MTEVSLGKQERLDDLMNGRHIIQNRQEFCFSMDAVLLAHFPQPRRGQRVLDLGTGAGVVPLLIADEWTHVDGIEINPVLADLARRNAALNRLESRIRILEGDYRELDAHVSRGAFDLVTANPPYRPVGSGKPSPASGRAQARHEITATLEDTVMAAAYALHRHGRFAMVHLPERLGEVMVVLHRHGLEAKRLRMVHPRREAPASLMLVEALSGGAAGGLKVLPPLEVRKADGNYTEEILEIYGMQP